MFKLNTQKTIKDIENNFIKTDLPVLKIGDNVKIGVKIIEGTKERVQFYEGTIIARKNSSINTTITVRKVINWYRTSFLDSFSKIGFYYCLRSSK
jgi:large subunit ribosomal protein L19